MNVLKLRLHRSRLECNFQKSLHYHRGGKTATCPHGEQAQFADRKIAMIFEVLLSGVFALPSQDMLHTQILMWEGSAIIS